MKCSSCCKYFRTTGFSGKYNPFGDIDHSIIHGNCGKYLISTTTDDDCFDNLPYDEK